MIKRSTDVLVPLWALTIHYLLLVFVLANHVSELGSFLLLDAMGLHRLADRLDLILREGII